MYGALTANSSDKLEKGELLAKQGLALYFYATRGGMKLEFNMTQN